MKRLLEWQIATVKGVQPGDAARQDPDAGAARLDGPPARASITTCG